MIWKIVVTSMFFYIAILAGGDIKNQKSSVAKNVAIVVAALCVEIAVTLIYVWV